MTEEYLSWTGEGIDCETCGWNVDEVSLEINGGEWDLYTRYGCYGGARFGSDLESNLADVLDELKHVRSFAESDLDDLDEIEARVRGVICENTH